MKRAILALAVVGFAAPALAQSALDADLKAFATKYVQTFNKGDTAVLAKDFYRVPTASAADIQAKFSAQLDALRKDEFGKMELFKTQSCSVGIDAARLQVDFVYNYTYGGVMPPGEQASMFDMVKTADGWRIVGVHEAKAGQAIACAS